MDHHHIWWNQHHYGLQPLAEAVAADVVGLVVKEEMEHMFEKTLTPSDVGKLNRLVIPKQHAERYFPIGLNYSVDSQNLLSFEDESGKYWEFRYSYWSSSQSYVLTKGWSRYVKKKALDTGDVVVFQQLQANHHRKFIGFRRKMVVPAEPPVIPAAGNWNGGRGPRVRYPAHTDLAYPAPSTYPYQHHCFNPGAVGPSQTRPSNGKSKTIRLFGVNVEYQPDPSQSDVSELSQSEAQYERYCTDNGHVSYDHNYMEYNMSGEANQMRYFQG